MHVHFHVIPKFADGRGLDLVWNAAADPDAASRAAALRHRLGVESASD
jgi:diadenosine tetraphosphate (Ap4A) HIT family hydrolase